MASRRHSRKCLRPNHTSWSTSFTNIIISHSEQPIWIVQFSSYDISRMQRNAYQYKKNLDIKFKYCIINQGLIRSIWRCWRKKQLKLLDLWYLSSTSSCHEWVPFFPSVVPQDVNHTSRSFKLHEISSLYGECLTCYWMTFPLISINLSEGPFFHQKNSHIRRENMPF